MRRRWQFIPAMALDKAGRQHLDIGQLVVRGGKAPEGWEHSKTLRVDDSPRTARQRFGVRRHSAAVLTDRPNGDRVN